MPKPGCAKFPGSTPGQIWPASARTRPKSAVIWPIPGRLWLTLGEFGQHRPNSAEFGRRRANLADRGRSCPKVGDLRRNIGRNSAETGRESVRGSPENQRPWRPRRCGVCFRSCPAGIRKHAQLCAQRPATSSGRRCAWARAWVASSPTWITRTLAIQRPPRIGWILAHSGPTLANLGPSRTDFGRSRANYSDSAPTSADLGRGFP